MTSPREPSRSFRDVLVWQKARKWIAAVYRYTATFPRTERYGMTAQLRDAATSVLNNFTEGFKRHKINDKAHFYNIAQASLEEARTVLIMAGDVGYGDPAPLLSDAEEIARILEGYVASMWRRSRRRANATRHVIGASSY